MRGDYVQPSETFWANYYLNQAKQGGAGFVGLSYQRGAGLGSFFRGVFRGLLPVLKSAGRSVGKQALSTTAQIASDLATGDSIKASAKRRGKQGVANLLRKAATNLEKQKGGKLGKRTIRKKRGFKLGKRPKATPRRKAKRQRKKDQLGIYYQ